MQESVAWAAVAGFGDFDLGAGLAGFVLFDFVPGFAGPVLFNFAPGFALLTFLDLVLCLSLVDLVDGIDAFARRGLLFSLDLLDVGAGSADAVGG